MEPNVVSDWIVELEESKKRAAAESQQDAELQVLTELRIAEKLSERWEELFRLLENGVERHNVVCNRNPSRTARIDRRDRGAEISSTAGLRTLYIECTFRRLSVSSEGLRRPFNLELAVITDSCGNVDRYHGRTPITSLAAFKLILYPLLAEL